MADLNDSFSGADKDAFAALDKIFEQYGLKTLSPKIKQYIQEGYSADTISLMLTDSAEYKQRFAANEERKKKGLRVLSPAEYISTENSYRRVLASYGLPPGMYDQQSDYQKFLSNDVSPAELQGRVDIAHKAVMSDNPAVRDTYMSWYAQGLSTGDAIAAVLDPEKALPLLERKARSAAIGAAAKQQGLSTSMAGAERLDGLGVTADQAQQGYSKVANVLPDTQALARRYGGDYTQADAENETFLGDATATQKRRRLNQSETAAFSGGAKADTRSFQGGGF